MLNATEATAPASGDAKALHGLALDAVVPTAWRLLETGAARGTDPFHTPVLATTGPDGPSARTVVLRHVDASARLIACHTDTRSPKVAALAGDNRASWLFYDRDRKLQLRLTGLLSLHTDDGLAHERWSGVSARGKACYRAPFPPGQSIDAPLPAPTPPADDASCTTARRRFAVLACRIETLDWLVLWGKGHRRARLLWADNAWSGSWIAP